MVVYIDEVLVSNHHKVALEKAEVKGAAQDFTGGINGGFAFGRHGDFAGGFKGGGNFVGSEGKGGHGGIIELGGAGSTGSSGGPGDFISDGVGIRSTKVSPSDGFFERDGMRGSGSGGDPSLAARNSTIGGRTAKEMDSWRADLVQVGQVDPDIFLLRISCLFAGGENGGEIRWCSRWVWLQKFPESKLGIGEAPLNFCWLGEEGRSGSY